MSACESTEEDASRPKKLKPGPLCFHNTGVDGEFTHTLFSSGRHLKSLTDIGAGSGPGRTQNQDAFLIKEIVTEDGEVLTVYIVADGHGNYGKLFSTDALGLIDYIEHRIGQIIIQYHRLGDIFEEFNEFLLRKHGDLACMAGTTVTLIISGSGFIICAHLGDCDAYTQIDCPLEEITFMMDGEGVRVSDKTLKLTDDHSPYNTREVESMIYNGGSILYRSNLNVKLEPFYDIVDTDEGERIYRQRHHTVQPGAYSNRFDGKMACGVIDLSLEVSKRAFYNLSRTLGDKNVRFMVRRPTISKVTFPIDTNIKLIVGSDGFFNCLRPSEIKRFFDMNLENFLENVRETVDRTFGPRADNTTVIALL